MTIKTIFLFCAFTILLPKFLFSQTDSLRTPDSHGVVIEIYDEETGERPQEFHFEITGVSHTIIDSSSNGSVFISLQPGLYRLQISSPGYKDKELQNLTITFEPPETLQIFLTPLHYSLKNINVTPGKFSVFGTNPSQSYTRDEINSTPHFGEDIYRAITRLPGVSSNDYSAKFNVRGGENDEVLVLFDGLELYEPFHMKDVNGGALSIIDVEAVENISLYTGGYTALFGNRMSGVFDISSRKIKPGKDRFSLALSLLNASASGEGLFAKDKGSWFVSARRGYIDLVLKLIGEDEENFSPSYYDAFSKVDYKLNDVNTLSAYFLFARDDLDFIEDDNDSTNTGYSNLYSWLNLKSLLSKNLIANTTLYAGRLTQDRNGVGFFGNTGNDVEFRVDDQRYTNLFGFKQSWEYSLSPRIYILFGGDLKKLSAKYDYFNFVNNKVFTNDTTFIIQTDTTSINLLPDGYQLGTYLSSRFKLFPFATLETGVRFDRTSYTGENRFSPRINTSIELAQDIFLRAGWGLFYQPEEIYQIHVGDGETEFFPSMLARHYVIGFEYSHNDVFNFRAEGYYKDISGLRPGYINTSTDIEMFPEVQEDRVQLNYSSATAKGAELFLNAIPFDGLSLWINYALTYKNDLVTSYVAQGTEYSFNMEVPGRYDQRHTFNIDASYKLTDGWTFGMAWQYHSGWPYTDRNLQAVMLPNGSVTYDIVPGEPYGENLPAFHRLDLRISKSFTFSKGQLNLFLDITNLYNHGNARGYDYSIKIDSSGNPYLEKTPVYWLPILPSIGVRWTFKL